MDIPNTTNTLDGSFSHLKEKITIHRGFPLSKIWKDFFVLFFKGLWMKVIVFGSELIASGCLSMYLF
jgi:hypothetical protein